MTNVRSAERALRDAPDGEHAAALGDPLDERQPSCDLRGGRATVRPRLVRANFSLRKAAWKAAPADERPLWKGLAQLAVGLTHEQRGNPRGASSLLRRGAETIGEAPEAAARHGVDLAALAGWAAAREASGPSAPGLVLRAR